MFFRIPITKELAEQSAVIREADNRRTHINDRESAERIEIQAWITKGLKKISELESQQRVIAQKNHIQQQHIATHENLKRLDVTFQEERSRISKKAEFESQRIFSLFREGKKNLELQQSKKEGWIDATEEPFEVIEVSHGYLSIGA